MTTRDSESETVVSDIDMAKHNRRYHPHGITENTTCKYLADANLKEVKSLKEDLLNPNGDKQLEEALKWLREEMGVECVHVHAPKELAAMDFNPIDLANLMQYGDPVSKGNFKDATTTFYETVKELKQRFPQFGFDDGTLFIPWNFIKSGGAGSSSLDRRWRDEVIEMLEKSGTDIAEFGRPESYITIGGVKGIPYSSVMFHHKGKQYPKDIVRHEIGHNLATKEVQERYISILDKLKCKYGYRDARKRIIDTVSYGAVFDEEEGVAEVFSVYTDPEYDGRMSKELESIAELMISAGEKKQKRGGKEMVGTDELKGQENSLNARLKRVANLYFPFSVICPLYAPEPDSIAWWDTRNCKYVYFDSEYEAFKYILKWHNIPDEDIRKITSAYAKENYDMFLAASVAFDMTWKMMTADEVIKEIEPLMDLEEPAEERKKVPLKDAWKLPPLKKKSVKKRLAEYLGKED